MQHEDKKFVVLIFRTLMVVVMFMSSQGLFAQNIFPTSSYIEKQVRFWEMVFDTYDNDTAIIHDNRFPEVILDIVEFKKYKDAKYRSYKGKRGLAEAYKRRYEIGMRHFINEGTSAANRGQIEQRIYNSYQRNTEAFDNLMNGKSVIRIQFGMAKEFRTALFRAMQYLPHMEQVFIAHDVPIELTRIPFIESMFNIKAESKVGAQGMWQFMPETAKSYMQVDSYIDERFSPYKATRAAAKFLKETHDRLESWPLAITAYNHGPTSIQKAVKSLGSNDLDMILRNYQAGSFGFASRNFYAEFLAANSIFNKYKHHLVAQMADLSTRMKSIRLSESISLNQLAKHTPLSPEVILKHNPEIKQKGFHYFLHNPLPKNFEIFFPAQLSDKVHVAVNNIKAVNL